MTCRHGTPAPHECFLAGQPPICPWCKIAELEAELEAVKHDKEGWYNADGYAEIVKRLEAENQQLRDKVADWQNRFTEGLQYDSGNNQTILVWTQREIDQAKSEADEICKALGIPLGKET